MNQFEFSATAYCFNLRSEETRDGERLRQEQEQRERTAKEAAELEAQRQIQLLDWEDTAKQYQAV